MGRSSQQHEHPQLLQLTALKHFTKRFRGVLHFVSASAASVAPVQASSAGLPALAVQLFHCKRIQVWFKLAWFTSRYVQTVLKMSLLRTTRAFAGLERATSKHASLGHWFLPQHNAASLEQGTSFLSCCGRCSSRTAIGTACSDPACFACLVLGFILPGDVCIVEAPAALEMQLRSQGLGTAEVFNRRSAGLKDVIHESNRQNKEIKALWSQRDGLRCI